ncbi:methionine ABC transporter permease [Aureibacillus halotolerans]|uniref:D-methionine transport system permease protein n=1 Tax=Aureibacillus halotolerans TaxID=1508390 RepID=A0A4R6U4N8_9BACI|nr:methionine ABC transporter permease [Aureibacillus halotolerans]TDQ40462.1 D-methionine transport system permease protein [Aureibacillus halotolerans]
MINQWFPNFDLEKWQIATYETVYMMVIGIALTFIFGILIGLLLFLTSKKQMWENRFIHWIVAAFVNVFRSIPFIILIILLLPFTKVLMGTILGKNAALPALALGAIPFYARLVEIAFREVNRGVVEAAQSMGAGPLRIMFRVYLPEAMPALISGITVTTIALIGYIAMAGAIGAGGLGDLAYQEGFMRSNPDVTVVATITILIIVFIVQAIGDGLTKWIDKR